MGEHVESVSQSVDTKVIIVGAGPAGLSTSACLNKHSIPNIVIEREDCCASLWKRRAYDRLKLHLAKQFCELPHMSYPTSYPTFVPRGGFIGYLDEYATRFGVRPRYRREVESACFDEGIGKWRVSARNLSSGDCEEYLAEFLVAATGENSEGYVPDVKGMEMYEGEFMHSSKYENGRRFENKEVLVVGCGNSGMEIAYDLSNYLAKASIVTRSPVHVYPKEVIFLGMLLLRFLPVNVVDIVVVFLSSLIYGRFSQYGLRRPTKGPFYLKGVTGRTPTIDVGAMKRIKQGEIKVYPSIKSVKGKRVVFENGDAGHFDAIVFATGYRTNVRKWLKGSDDLFNDQGLPKLQDQWKGENGLFCAGFAKRGLAGISRDAAAIADDINLALRFLHK